MDVAPTRGRGTGGREKPNTGSSLDEAALFQSRAQATTAVVASLGSHGQAGRGGGAVQAAPWPPDATREAWRSTHVYTDRLGGEEAGYEQIRPPKPDPTDFKLTFDLNTEEHRAWKAAVGTI